MTFENLADTRDLSPVPAPDPYNPHKLIATMSLLLEIGDISTVSLILNQRGAVLGSSASPYQHAIVDRMAVLVHEAKAMDDKFGSGLLWNHRLTIMRRWEWLHLHVGPATLPLRSTE